MRIVILSMLIILLAGCSTTATIYKTDGTLREAEIKKSDTYEIYLSDGTSISRRDIRDIDHPGEILAISSGISGFIGLAMSSIGVSAFSRHELAGPVVGYLFGISGLVILVPSIIIFTWNLSVYRSSSNAAEPPESLKFKPLAMTEGERTYWGLGMMWEW